MRTTVESANDALTPAAIGQILSRRRKLLDLTLEEVGRRTGMNPTQLSRLENGHGDPRVSTLSRAMGGLGLTLEDLADAGRVGDVTARGGRGGRPANAVDYEKYEGIDG